MGRGWVIAWTSVVLACGPDVGTNDEGGSTSGDASASTIGPTTEGPTTSVDSSSESTSSVDTSGGSTESTTGGDEYGEGDAVCPFPAEDDPDPCTEAGCFEMCGTPILLRPYPSALGADTITAPPRRGYPVSSVVHVGDIGVRNESIGITVRDAADVVLAELPFVGGPSAAVGDIVLSSAGPIDFSDPASPVVHDAWRPQLHAGPNGQRPSTTVWLLGTARGAFVFATPAGISFVDASDPSAPFESECVAIDPDESITPVGVTDDTLVRIRILGEGTDPPPRVFLHDLDAGDPSTPTNELPFGNEGRWAMEGARLMIESAPDMVLYELDHGEAIEIGRREWTHNVYYGPPVVGGLAFVSPSEDGMSYALDLRADGDPAVYAGPRLEPNDYDEQCLLTFDVVEGSGESIALSPWYEPQARFDPAMPPVHPCAVEPTPPPWARSGALAPSADRIAVTTNDGAVVFDLQSGASTLLAEAEVGHWTAGGLMLVSSYQGDAEGSDFIVQDADDPSIALGEFPSRGFYHGGAASSTRLWLLTSGGEPPGPDRIVWSLPVDDLFGEQTDAAVPADATIDAIAAGPVEIYAIDDEGRVLVFDEAGSLVHDVALPHGAEAENIAASSLGLFVRGSDGVLQWVAPETAALRTDAHGCREWLPRAANDERIFALERDPGGTTWMSVSSTIAIVPTPTRAGLFELSLDDLRLPGFAGGVLPGPPLVVLASTPVWIE